MDHSDLPPLGFDPHQRFADDLPATGALQPGDPVGQRRFVTVTDGRPFALEGGGRIDEVVLAYESWGSLNAGASNAVLVCHALTGDSHAHGAIGPGHPEDGWWNDLIGPGKALDTDRWFVVCANVLGGCQGSTGPSSVVPGTDRRYGADFPQVTIRDLVRSQRRLADRLGIGRWLAVVGGSMGGMQVLEWGAMFPDRVDTLLPIATTAAASAQQISWSAVQRVAIVNDPQWAGGDYYDAPPGKGPWAGLALAREISQITYRTTEVFDERFGRHHTNQREEFSQWGRYDVESYLDHHGQKLVRRFDANTFLVLSKAMDLHDIGRGRGGVAAALARLQMPVLTASITSDVLYPAYQQAEIHAGVEAAGGTCEYHVIDSPQGHDGFLLESAYLGPLIARTVATAEEKR
ncbi:MAG: homoserine O-acetyltransferase [Acidimicrobiales bacterium]|nr:homoserine O-acetyltransferase [Acidimicrobiales bacterium]